MKLQSNFGLCFTTQTLYIALWLVSGSELRTNKWMDKRDGRTKRRTILYLDALMDLSDRGHKNQNAIYILKSKY